MPASDQEKLFAHAVAAHRAGDETEARARYKALFARFPNSASAYSNYVPLLKNLKFPEIWIRRAFYKSTALDPGSPAAYNNFANYLSDIRKFDESRLHFQTCLFISPNYIEAISNLAISFFKSERYYEAAILFYRSYRMKPNPDVAFQLANALFSMNMYETAIKIYDYLISQGKGTSHILSNLGVIFRQRGRYDRAIAAFSEATRTGKEENGDLSFNLSFALLSVGRFADGFDMYEGGFVGPNARAKRGFLRPSDRPRWNGESLRGKTLFIYNEQGIGDELMFGTLIADAKRIAKRIYLEVSPRLAPVYKRSFPDMVVLPYASKSPAREKLMELSDYVTPVGSLARVFRRSPHTFGRNRPFIHPDPNLVRTLRRDYQAIADGRPIVGIGWKGGTGVARSKGRSITLRTFMEELASEDVLFVSVQYGKIDKDLKSLSPKLRSMVHVDHRVDPLKSIDLSLAQINAVDLVISTSNAGVHTAGASGVPCWNLIPHVSDWRWIYNRHDCIWYPGMRIYRQRAPDDWLGVLQEIKQDLKMLKPNKTLWREADPALDWIGVSSS